MSLVLPCDSEISRFEDTLASVLRYLPEQTQVIAVHDGSYGDPHGLDEVDFVVNQDIHRLGGSLNAALRISNAPLVGLIRPGIQLDEGWQVGLLDSFDDLNVGSVTPAIVSEQSPNRLVTAGVGLGKAFKRRLIGTKTRLGRKASRLRPLAPSSWAAFYRREVLDMLGTPDAEIESHYLDLDLALGIRQLGFVNEFQQDTVLTIEDPDWIVKEFQLPHGYSAARAKIRFGDRSSGLGESLLELLGSPFKPWLVKHVFGKLSARAMKDIDESFYRRLVRKSQELKSQGESEVLAMPHRDHGEQFRRAA
jgi:hypothetical protein